MIIQLSNSCHNYHWCNVSQFIFFISSIHPTNLPQTNYPKPVTAIIGVNLSINLSSYLVTTRVSKIQPKHYSTDTSATTMRNIVFLFCLDNCTLCTATAVVNNRVVGEEPFLFNSSQPFTFRDHYPFMGWVQLHKETKLKKLLQAIDKRWSCESSSYWWTWAPVTCGRSEVDALGLGMWGI